MNLECLRIADQLRQAFVGDPWLGPSMRSVLDKFRLASRLQLPRRVIVQLLCCLFHGQAGSS